MGGPLASAALVPLVVALLVASMPAAPSVYAARVRPGGKTVVNIIHLNDVHNRIEAASSSAAYCSRANDDAGVCYGGYARIAQVVQSARQRDPQVLFLDAGDEFMGSIFDTVYQGNATADLQNMIGVDAMTLGNHEFDFGTEVLARYIRRVNHPILGACNVDTSQSKFINGSLVKKYIIKRIRGFDVAIYGLTTPETALISRPGDNVTFNDPATGLAACIREVKARYSKVKLHIALTHLGYDQDIVLAQTVKGVDLIIGGHSHTYLKTNTTPPLLKNASDPNSFDQALGPYPTYVPSLVSPGRVVPVTTAFYASRYMGNLTMTVDRIRGGILHVRGKPHLVGNPMLLGGSLSGSSNVPRRADVDAKVQELAVPVNAYNLQVIGSTTFVLDQTTARTGESTMGNAVCDALVEYVKYETDFEQVMGPINICFTNGGGLRASIPAGNITTGQVVTVLPFANVLTIKQVTGQTIIDSLQYGMGGLGPGAAITGRFPQVAGIKYVFNASLPLGSRITYVRLVVDGQDVPVDPCATYNLVSNDYTAAGGDGYAAIGASRTLLATGPALDLVFANYIKLYSPLAVVKDGRITACSTTAHPSCAAPETYATCSPPPAR